MNIFVLDTKPAISAQMHVPAFFILEVPYGATHYSGELINDEPVFFKCTQVAGSDHWWFYDHKRKNWFLSGHTKPHWVKELAALQQTDLFS